MATEIKEPDYEIGEMTRAKDKINLDSLKRKSKSNTFRGYLNGCLQKAINDKNHELELLFREILEVFNRFYPQRIVKNEIEIVEGWKGEGHMEIYKGFTNDFIIKEHIKDKETSKVTESIHTVKKEDLNRIIYIIKNLPLNEPYKCYYFAEKLGYGSWKDLWKIRKDYFRFYYYCVKVCEALGIITYSGRGTITRIK